MTEQAVRHRVPIPADRVYEMLAMAARAPSVLNTQPWRFRVGTYSIELHADYSRRLRADLAGRDMLMSCGAALFGLRLAIRSLGYSPVVQLLPSPERPGLIARVALGAPSPLTEVEQQMLSALPHRHTHRDAFTAEPLPPGLIVALQHDAIAEHAALALIDGPARYGRLAAIVADVARHARDDHRVRADLRQWVRLPGSTARDGIPAAALPPQAGAGGPASRRALDGFALPARAVPGVVTAALITPADTRADWIRAGQALYRLLLHAASRWVFANLHSQALDSRRVRALIQSRIGLPGPPQVLLQLGVARVTLATPRRPADELTEPGRAA